MSRSAVRARPGQDRTSLYEEITNKLIAERCQGENVSDVILRLAARERG